MKVQLEANGPSIWRDSNDHTATPDDPVIEVSEEYAAFLLSEGPFEEYAPEPETEREAFDSFKVPGEVGETVEEAGEESIENLLSQSVPDIRSQLRDGDFDDDIEAVQAYEENNGQRKTVFDEIEKRR